MRQIQRILAATACISLQLGCDADPGAPSLDDVTQRDTGACGYRTQTQLDWGAVCGPTDLGYAPTAACLRDEHFTDVFYEGLVVGCGVKTANLVTPGAVALALPTSGKVRALHVWESGAYDGDGDPTVGTAFFGHVVALALNLEFDGMPDYNLQHPGLPLADLVVADADSPCLGMRVEDVFLAASAALGGCPTDLTPIELSGCVSLVNAAYRGGTDPNGVPICDDRFAQPTLAQ
jgi:hypothetical protein